MIPKAFGFASFLLLSIVGSPALADSGLRTVALSGQPVEEAGPGLSIETVSVPQIDARGHVAFTALLAGTDIIYSNRSAIFRERESGLDLVARQGVSPALLNEGAMLTTAHHVIYNAAGDLVFNARSGLLDSVYRVDREQSDYSLITTSNDPFPGAEDSTELAPQAVGFNNNGHILIQSYVSGDYVNYNGRLGVMVANPTAELHGIVRGSSLVQDRDDDEWYFGFDLGLTSSRVMNDLGQVAFLSELRTTRNHHDEAVFISEDISSIQSLAQRWDDLPYDESMEDPSDDGGRRGNSGARIANLKFTAGLSINNQSQVAFVADLGGVSGDGVVIAEPGRDLTLVAHSGDKVVGAPDGTVVGSSIYSATLNGKGQLAVICSTSRPGESGKRSNILRQNLLSGEVELIVGEGDRVPGSEKVLFFGGFDVPAMNGIGQIVFEAALEDVWGVGIGTGVFAADVDGSLHAIAVPGQVIDVASSEFQQDLRTMTSARFVGGSGGEDGRGSGLSDFGQIAFSATFGDASGIFVSNAIAIPEPSAVILFALACALGWLRKGRRQLEGM